MVRASTARRSRTRAELHGETVFCYLRDAAARDREPARRSRGCASCTGAANLEDLFLKLTGREMRE